MALDRAYEQAVSGRIRRLVSGIAPCSREWVGLATSVAPRAGGQIERTVLWKPTLDRIETVQRGRVESRHRATDIRALAPLKRTRVRDRRCVRSV
jgi:hypothetical protein